MRNLKKRLLAFALCLSMLGAFCPVPSASAAPGEVPAIVAPGGSYGSSAVYLIYNDSVTPTVSLEALAQSLLFGKTGGTYESMAESWLADVKGTDAAGQSIVTEPRIVLYHPTESMTVIKLNLKMTLLNITQYTLTIPEGAVQSSEGKPLCETCKAVISDNVAPIVQNFSLSRNNRILTINLSETVLTRDRKSLEEYITRLGLAESDNNTDLVYKALMKTTQEDVRWVNIDSLVLRDRQIVITFTRPLTKKYNYLRIEENTLYDLVGNVLATDKTLKVEDGSQRRFKVIGPFDATIDYYPPEIDESIPAYATVDNKQVVITFDEPIFNNMLDLPTLRDSIRLAVFPYVPGSVDPILMTPERVALGDFGGASGAPPHILLHNDNVKISGNQLILTFVTPLPDNAFVAVRLPSDALKDKAGNVHDPVLQDLPGMDHYQYHTFWYSSLVDTISDRVAPQYVDCWLNEDHKTITLNFSEPVRVTVPGISDPDWLKTATLKHLLELKRDGDSEYRALDEVDRWGDELIDDIRIEGSNIVIVLKEALQGKQNTLRLTAREVLCDYAKDTAPWRENNYLAATFTTKLLDATADITPPHLLAESSYEVSPDTRIVTLLFSENLVNNLKSTTELRNALNITFNQTDTSRVTRALSTFDPSSTVTLSGSKLMITFSQGLSSKLTCAEEFKFVDLTLVAQTGTAEGAVKDTTGNVQRADQTAAGIDVRGDRTPPRVQNIIVSPSRQTVTIYFDEDLKSPRSASGLVANIMILRDYAGATLPLLEDFRAREAFFATATISKNTLILTTKTPLVGNMNYILIRGSSLSDLVGNLIPNDLTLGPLDANPDVTPPELLTGDGVTQYWLSADRKTLKLFFNELIYPVVSDMTAFKGNIGRSTQSATGPFFDLDSGDKVTIDGYTLTIQFAQPLTGAVNHFRLADGLIRDAYFNMQMDIGKLTTVRIDATPDELPPVYTGHTLSKDNRVITLHFNEPLALAVADLTVLRNFLYFTDAATYYPLERFYPGYTVAVSGSDLVITLPETRPLVGKLNRIKLLPNALQDRATPTANVLTLQVITAAIAAWADETPPDFNALTGTTVSADRKTITLTFSEPLYNNTASLTALKSSVLIAANGTTYTALSVNDTVKIGGTAAEPGRTLIITLQTPISGEKTKIKINRSALKDASGNVLAKDTVTNAISATDITPPTFNPQTGVSINDSTKKQVTLTFSETVISGFSDIKALKAAITVSREGGAFMPLEEKDTVSVSGGKLTVTFATALTGNNNFIHLPAGSLSDKTFNAMTTAVDTLRIYATPPAFAPATGLSISDNKKIVVLTFDRTIHTNSKTADDLKKLVKLSRNGGSFAALGALDTVDVIDGKLYLTFHSQLDELARISIGAKAVRDYVGNTNTSEIVTGPYDYREALFDQLTGLSLSADKKVVTLTFNKTMFANVTDFKAAVQLRRNGGAAAALGVQDQAYVSGGKVVVVLDRPLMGENNTFLIAGKALIDHVQVVRTQPVEAGPIDAGVYLGSGDVTLNGASADVSSLTVAKTAAGFKIATVTLEVKKLTSALSNAPTGVVVEASCPDTVDGTVIQGFELQLSGDVLYVLQGKNAVLVARRGDVRYLLPVGEIDLNSVAVQLGQYFTTREAVTFTVAIRDTDTKLAQSFVNDADKSGYTILSGLVDFDVSVQSSVRQLPLDRYANRIERRFVLTGEQAKMPNVTGVVLDNKGAPVHIPTILKQEGGTVYASLWSFTNSPYAVVSAVRTFPDVQGQWSQPYVENMAGRFMLFGDTKGRFNPYSNMTRAEFAAVMIRALGLSKTGVGVDRFGDVKKSDWFYDVTSIASEYKIMNGYADGSFRPNNPIKREEAMVCIFNAVKLLEGSKLTIPTDSQAQTVLSRFKDNGQVSASMRAALAVCIRDGIVEGANGKINPKANIRRDEVCALMTRFMKVTKLIG